MKPTCPARPCRGIDGSLALGLPLALRLLQALLLALLCGTAVAADQQETQSQLRQLKAEMGKLQELLKDFQDERSRLRRDLRQSEVEMGKAERRVREIEQQLEVQEDELQQLREERDTLRESRRQQQGQIERQVRAAYALGREDKVKTLLNQEDPARVSRVLTYYDYFNRARAEQIEGYIDLIAELDRVEPAIEAKTENLRSTRDDLDRQRRQLSSARQEREQALAKLAGTIESKDAELKQLAQDRGALEALLRKLEQQSKIATPKPVVPGRDAGTVVHSGKPAAAGKPFRDLRGQLPWPVTGRPGNRFGSRRGDSDLKWQGINIAADEGTTVHAVHSGSVVFADWLRGSGLLLIIDHGAGYLSLYAHNQSLLRNVGERVEGGDPIATVGNSGGQQQAALYFEIRQRGAPLDPAQWCRRS